MRENYIKKMYEVRTRNLFVYSYGCESDAWTSISKSEKSISIRTKITANMDTAPRMRSKFFTIRRACIIIIIIKDTRYGKD